MKPLRVHIVDDSRVIRESLKDQLSDIASLEICGESETVAAARADILRTRPDLAILDLKMPDGTGMDLLAALKPELPETTFIIFTDYPYPAYRTRSLALGADYFFVKAEEHQDLVDLVATMARDQTTSPQPVIH